MKTADVIVIGGGIAGAGAAATLAREVKVLLLEAEDRPGYHTTGRSAAVYLKGFGNEVIRELTAASEAFFVDPPNAFSDVPLTRVRGALTLVRPDQIDKLSATLERLRQHVPEAQILTNAELAKLVPALKPDYATTGIFDSSARDIDVGAIFQGYLKTYKRRGGQLCLNASVTSLKFRNGSWHVTAGEHELEAPIVVNAAGAWADTIASKAGLVPLGLVPMRRTAFLVEPPNEFAIDDWPVVDDIDEEFYFRPEAGKLFCSPADETPSEACDAQPEELDIAVAVSRIERALPLNVRRVHRSWAGLRTFASDRTPVVGFDPRCDGFFWLAGQGGYGIQTAPALSVLASELVLSRSPAASPGRLRDQLAPDRLIH